MTDVNEYEDIGELYTLEDVLRNHLLQFVALRLRTFGIAITGKVHQIPFLVDNEMVDQERLAGSR